MPKHSKGECISFDTIEDAQEFILCNPHKVRTTEFMEVVRPMLKAYVIGVYKFTTDNGFNAEFVRYLREEN